MTSPRELDGAQTFSAQWFGDEGSAMVFYGQDCIATVTSGSRSEVTQRLKLLGWRPKRWRKTDWGYESTLERIK